MRPARVSVVPGGATTNMRSKPLARSMKSVKAQEWPPPNWEATTLRRPSQRLARVIKVKQQLSSSTITLQDKYRVLLEAFQQELEFGRGIEAWRGDLKLGEENLTVEFLRFGRTAFYFQSMDGQRSGYWDRAYKQWVEVPREYNEDIKHGLRIARNQLAPQLLALPMKR